MKKNNKQDNDAFRKAFLTPITKDHPYNIAYKGFTKEDLDKLTFETLNENN